MDDYIVSAMAANEQIRAFACTTRNLAEESRRLHNTSPVMSAALGRLLTAGTMMGSMLKGEKDVLTLQIRGEGPAQGLTVTAGADSYVRGYAIVPDVCIPAKPNGKLDVSGAVGPGSLRVIKDMGLKDPYIGEVELQTGEIAEDLTYYFAVSEQVPSCVGLGVLMNKENTVRQAGGFIIQLLPFASDETIEKLEDNLKNIKSVTTMLDEGDTPEEMLRRVLDGFDVEFTSKRPCGYRCTCSRERLEKVMISLGRKELGEMIEDGKTIEVGCQFCNSKYSFTVDELSDLLGKSINS